MESTLLDFLWEKYLGATVRAASTIMEAEELLKSSPRLGRPLSDGSERRELSLPFGTGAYILYYRLQDENAVVILRVWHRPGGENKLSRHS